MQYIYDGNMYVTVVTSTIVFFTQEKLSKCVNMRAMNMLGQAEEKVSQVANIVLQSLHHYCLLFMISLQYNDLIKKKKIVENDKSKIAAVITELDQKKNEALQNAWKKVNKVRNICMYVHYFYITSLHKHFMYMYFICLCF